MKESIASMFTPQRKLIDVNKRYGNNSIKTQQGSTVAKWDTLAVTATTTTLRFFEGATNRLFPFTNINSEGNRLPVGSSLICARAYLTLMTYDPTEGFTALASIDTSPAIASGDFTLMVANKEVIKNVPLMSWIPDYNKSAGSVDYNNFEFDTQVALLPLLEYVATVRFGNASAAFEDGTYLRLTIEGTGAIISPSSPF
tara:strand:+ start:7827 stop:8423 length:597 start_codon:yes stop_codon:yes gene_type:complete